jgi:hypothetical protein
MPQFDARLRLPGYTRLPLGVEVDIDHARMTVTAGDRRVGAWPLDKLEVEAHPDGFHITVEGEAIILSVAEAARFATALGVSRAPRPTLGSYRTPPPELTENGHQVPPPGTGAPNGAKPAPSAAELREKMEERISTVAGLLESDDVSPAEAFVEWVRLLKELNHRHGQGSLPSDHYFRLNTKVLDLIPEPKPRTSDDYT